MTTVGQPLLILGMHRSGTSYLAALLQSMGVHIGDKLVGPQKGNPRGHFEAVPVLEFHEALLAEAQGVGAPPFDKGIFVTKPLEITYTAAHRAAARAILAGLQQTGPWGWKEPRTCLFLDLWKELLPEARAVMVYRHPLEVHQSLLRRGHWGLALQPGLAMETYTRFNRAMLQWNGTGNYLFNASTGYGDLDSLRADLRRHFNLSVPEGPDAFVANEFHSLPVSKALHALTHLLFPEAAAVFDSLQQRADKPYQWADRPDDEDIKQLMDVLSPLVEGSEPMARARLLPIVDTLVSGGLNGLPRQYETMATEICQDYEASAARHKTLGLKFTDQQQFLQDKTRELESLWAEFEALGTQFKDQQTFLQDQTRERQKLWNDFQALGAAFKDQQTFLKGQAEKYGHIWDDHLRLKNAHDWLAEQFRAQQLKFAEQTNELRRLQEEHRQLGEGFVQQQAQFEAQCLKEKATWADHQALGKAFAEQQAFLQEQTKHQGAIWNELRTLQEEHQRLGKAFSSQQGFLNKQTITLGAVWSDYASLQEKHQRLGKEFKKQQENMSRLWDNGKALWEENQQLKKALDESADPKVQQTMGEDVADSQS
jgi:hypothetical protein